MNKHWLISITALALAATNSFAADTTPPAAAPAAPAATESSAEHDWTLEEARKHAHEKADKLDKMTPQEWAEHEKRYHAWQDKWHSMTPAEKEAWKQKKHDERAAKKAGAATSSATPAPAATPAGEIKSG